MGAVPDGSQTSTAAASADANAGKADLANAATALRANRPDTAESLLRKYLSDHPADIAASGMLAEALLRLERGHEAEALLARCVEAAPDHVALRHHYASVLLRHGKLADAIAQTDILLQQDPHNPTHRNLKATACVGIGDYKQALAEYELLQKTMPGQLQPLLAYAHTLRTAGRSEQCIAAWRKIVEMFPALGEAWWSLASLQTFRFEPAEIDRLRTELECRGLPFESRAQMHFALGKALDDEAQYAESMAEYCKGNAIVRSVSEYDADRTTAHGANCRALFTQEFFRQREGSGCSASDPIFLVGMPRSGSTLIEQILASHSAIEGTTELRVLPYLAERIVHTRIRETGVPVLYPEFLAELDGARLKELGEEYLERARLHRRTSRPFFIDKLPANFAHIGLIHMILPNARIIDARRHPLACGYSCYRHYFPEGKNFAYGLTDIGRYYRDYVELTAHFDAVLPGRIHRVMYEAMVEDPQREIRRLFEYLELPFEAQCLRFYDNKRVVQTVSSEQVRIPIYKNAVVEWRRHEEWLGPLKNALGPVLDAYPEVPVHFEPAMRLRERPPRQDWVWRRDRHLWAELDPVREPQVVNSRRG